MHRDDWKTLLRAAPLLAALQLGCGDDGAGKRPLGAACEEPAECESGRCVASLCIDPRIGDDGKRYVPAVAYVTRARVGANIAIVTLAADGTLAEHADSPYQTGVGDATELVFTPDGRHAYVGSGQNGQVAVHALHVDPVDFTPSTNPFDPLVVSSGLKQWIAVAMHPAGAFLYAADAESDGDRIYAYAIDSAAEPGRLVPTDSSVGIFDVERLAIDPRGRYLIAANDQDYGVFDVAPDGAPTGILGTPIEHQAPDFIRCVVFGASGDAVYLLTNTALHAFVLDRAGGGLTEVVGSPFEMAGGDVLEAHPRDGLLYESGNGAIFVHRINPSGTVALVDRDDDALNGLTGYGAGFTDLTFDHTGDLLYATGATTESFFVGADGLLTPISSVAVSGDRIGALSVVR